MTIKLFENDSLLKQCIAKVTACTPKDGKYLVELDQTVFFPEGGGQLSDRGKLADAVVSHVSERMVTFTMSATSRWRLAPRQRLCWTGLCVWTECSSIWASIFCPTPAGSCLRPTISASI